MPMWVGLNTPKEWDRSPPIEPMGPFRASRYRTMSRPRWRSWLGGVVLGTCVAGCKGLLGSQGPPPDPLFANHKPQESKAEQAAPVAIAFAEPQVPTDPAVALARSATPKRPSTADQTHGGVPGIL